MRSRGHLGLLIILFFGLGRGDASAQADATEPADQKAGSVAGLTAVPCLLGAECEQRATSLAEAVKMGVPEGEPYSLNAAARLRAGNSSLSLRWLAEEAYSLTSVATDSVMGPIAAEGNRRGIPYMIVGGALFVGGAIIGGDGGTILMLGGVAVGAYGLYVYLQ